MGNAAEMASAWRILASRPVRRRALLALAAMLVTAASAHAPRARAEPLAPLPRPGEDGLLIRGAEQWAAQIPPQDRIDGIADQNIPLWDGSFAGSPFVAYLRSTWLGEPPSRVRYARYVVQWNMMQGRAPATDQRYYEAFSAWYRDVRSLGLIPVVALGRYEGPPPSSATLYEAALAQLLSAFPAPYVEAWNEPNLTPGLSPAAAARLMDVAYAYCRGHGCVAIAGDFADTPGSAVYAERYRARLSASEYPQPRDPPEWAVHPYEAANAGGGEAQAIRTQLEPDDELWITEVGAYACRAPDHELGEAAQAASAERLLDAVIPALDPVHVFYYELMYKDGEQTPCSHESDTALYAGPGDRARAAASVILGS